MATAGSQESKNIAAAGNLNESEFKVYDRQLRLWGFDAQQKMKNSLVLVVNLTPTCTELARHLVLSGINIHLIDDGQKLIEQSDVDSDFLFSAGDIGRRRCEIVKRQLSEMNPFVKIEFGEDQSEVSLEQ